MTEKGISNIDKLKEELEGRGVSISDDSLFVIIDVVSSTVSEQIQNLQETVRSLKESIESLSCLYKTSEQSIKTLSENLDRTLKEKEELLERLKEAEAKNNRNSSNSNRPSSWDHFDKPKPSPKRSVIFSGGTSSKGKKNEKRSSGGQIGHKGTTMKLKEVPDNVVDVCPGECRLCSRYRECLLSSTVKETRSVVDVELRSVQTDYVLRSFTCPNRGKELVGQFPENMKSRFQYGPMTKAIVTDLSADGAMSMERIKVFMNTLFGFNMSDGTVKNTITKGAKLGKEFTEKVKEAISKSKVAHFDETGGRYMGKNGWFHIAATKLYTMYGFHQKRGKEGIEALGVYSNMRDPSQVAVTDFWSPYITLDGNNQKRHAFCMAHLDRELQNLIDNYGNPACARKMQKLLDYAYVKVQKLKGEGRTEADNNLLDEVSFKYDRIVTAALNKCKEPKKANKKGRPSKGKIRALFERFRDYKNGVLMFLNDFDVPASNNTGELAAKGLKTKLKVSECFRGATGPDDFCVIKSILETARKHGLNHLNILKDLFSGKDIAPSFSL